MRTDNPPERVIRIIADMIGEGVDYAFALLQCSVPNVLTECFTAMPSRSWHGQIAVMFSLSLWSYEQISK